MKQATIGGLFATALVGVLALGGCAERPTGPEEELADLEARAIAEFTAEYGTMDGVVSWGTGTDASREREFSHTRDCPGGGTSTLSGERSSTFDEETRVVSTEWQSTRNHDACTFTHRRGDRRVTVTLDGSIATEGSASHRLPEARGEGRTLLSYTATRVGEMVRTVGDRRRACEIDVTESYEPATDTFRIVGTVCGREVDVTRRRGTRHRVCARCRAAAPARHPPGWTRATGAESPERPFVDAVEMPQAVEVA